MKWHLIFLALLLILPTAAAEADWKEIIIKYNWDRSSFYYCNESTQCLVHEEGNPAFDSQPEKYFEATSRPQFPRCIDSGQFILDYYCDNGNWTTRTRLVADQLVQTGSSLSADYSVHCTNYEDALNNYQYIIDNNIAENYIKDNCAILGQTVNCTNNFCVMKSGDAAAFGTSLNSDEGSFFTAIEKDENICDGTSGNAFSRCADEVWYNPELKLVLFTPEGIPEAADKNLFGEQKKSINDYLMSALHDPDSSKLNFAYFSKTNLFNNVYFAKSGNKIIFGFLEENIKEDNSGNPAPMDFIGVRYENIGLGEKPCDTLIKKYDDKAFCEEQSGSAFNVVGRHREQAGASPIVQAWNDLTGKLRLK